MILYIFRRILLMIPTLFIIMVINFILVQSAPGGPVEHALAKLAGFETSATQRIEAFADKNTQDITSNALSTFKPELLAQIKKQYGLDKPPLTRFWLMIKHYICLDFGESFFQHTTVTTLIAQKLPVSISLGLWTTLFIYALAIPLGIKKAVKEGSHYDFWTSLLIVGAYAIPSFLLAVFLLVLFASGSYWNLFPLKGLVSDNWDTLSRQDKILDYLWHLALPVFTMITSGFATLTLLTKNAFLDEIKKCYVYTAYAKGLSERQVLYRHIFRNAMLVVIASFPSTLVAILFTNTLLIEVMFSLDGLGLLGFEAAINRDYPVVFGALYIFTLTSLFVKLISDVLHTAVDPRIQLDQK